VRLLLNQKQYDQQVIQFYFSKEDLKFFLLKLHLHQNKENYQLNILELLKIDFDDDIII
jgi:hypothetical protein